MKKLEVGQTVYVKPIGNAARRSTKIITCKISKVGRKYFELDLNWMGRFEIESMTQDNGDYISNYACYLSLQEIEDEKELNELYKDIGSCFNSFSAKNYSLKQLRAVKNILNNP